MFTGSKTQTKKENGYEVNAVIADIAEHSYDDSTSYFYRIYADYTADGELRFDYMCELKEKSRKQKINIDR